MCFLDSCGFDVLEQARALDCAHGLLHMKAYPVAHGCFGALACDKFLPKSLFSCFSATCLCVSVVGSTHIWSVLQVPLHGLGLVTDNELITAAKEVLIVMFANALRELAVLLISYAV